MKISYRTHSSLQKLNDGKLGKLSVELHDQPLFCKRETMLEIKEYFKQLCMPEFHYYYITNPFESTVTKSVQKLSDSSLWVGVPEGSYCFISSKYVCALKIKNDTKRGIINCKSAAFINNNPDPVLNHLGEYDAIYDIDKNDNGLFKANQFIGYERINSKESGIPLVSQISDYFIYLLFMKYAEVETVDVGPGKRNNLFDCKYTNETEVKITILNSTWFTTLVKSDAFKVRGHFRFQPCGEGLKDRKLIWINEFQKEGYTAPARKLSAEQ